MMEEQHFDETLKNIFEFVRFLKFQSDYFLELWIFHLTPEAIIA